MRNTLLFIAFILCCGAAVYYPVQHDSTLTGEGTVESPLGVTRGGEIAPAQITTDKDDYNPTGWDNADVILLSGDDTIRAITSFAAPTAADKPNRKTLINTGSYPLYIPGEHPDGTAANRVSTACDFILYPKQSIEIYYDETNTRWRIVGEQVFRNGVNGAHMTWEGYSSTAADYGDVAFQALNTGANIVYNATTTFPIASNFIHTASSATGGYAIYFAKTAIQHTAIGKAHSYVEAWLTIEDLSTAGETFTVELQITPSPFSGTLEQNNTVGIRYSHGINSGKWEIFNQDNAGAESVADAGVTVAADTQYKLSLWTDKANTETRAYINDVYVGRVTGSRPATTACGTRVIILKSNGTTQRGMYVHSLSAGAIYK